MCQVYHENAKLNKHSREIIQKSLLTNVELSVRFGVNEKTVGKWKRRDFQEDKSSRNRMSLKLSSFEENCEDRVPL